MSQRNNEVALTSFDDLISSLEYVDLSDLVSDIPENTRAELKRIRRNVSCVLSLLDEMLLLEGDARVAADEARRECLLINRIVFQLLFLQRLRMPQTISDPLLQLRVCYRALAESCHHLCLVADPERASSLAEAFQMA